MSAGFPHAVSLREAERDRRALDPLADAAEAAEASDVGDAGIQTVLIVSGGGLQGLALISVLQQLPGLRVLVADNRADNLSHFVAHGFHHAPPLDQPERFDSFLYELCRREQVRHVFPATAFELSSLARLRPRLQGVGCEVWVCSPSVVELNDDKLAFAQWLGGHGLPSLPTLAQPDAAIHAGAWIGKPRNGWGGRGLVRVESPTADVLPVPAGAAYVWQPFVDVFDEYSVDVAADNRGAWSPWVARRRARTLGGFTILSEPAAADVAELIRPVIERLLAALVAAGARGVLNLQLMIDAQQAVWVSDFNARVGTSMPLSVSLGHDPVAWLLLSPGGRPTPAAPAARTVRTVRTIRLMQQRHFVRPDLRRIRGVVFDLDDTLIDHKAWMLAKLERLWAAQHEALGLGARERFLAHTLHLIEEGQRARLFDVYAEENGRGDAERRALIDAYRQALPPACPMHDDVPGTLMQLRQRGFRLACLTDNPASSQRQKLERSALPALLDATVLSAELGTQKPDRRTFDAAAAALGLSADEVVMVGDNVFRDVWGALESDYAHAFHIQRPGAFFNHAVDTWRSWRSGWTSLHTLSELDWYLQEANP